MTLTISRAMQLARDAYSSSTDYFDANVRQRMEQDIRMFQSKHAAGSKYLAEAYRHRSRLFRPKTRSAIRKNEAIAAEAFFSTLDTVSVNAEDEQDPLQQASAEAMKALLEYRLQKTIPWFLLVIGAYQDAMVTGAVISHQDWEFDPVKRIDRPVIELVPLENFRFDPAASWYDPVNSSPYLIELIPMYLKDIKRRMREGPAGEEPKWLPMPDDRLKSEALSYDSTQALREDGALATRETNITEFSLVWVRRYVVELDGIDYLYYTLGDSAVLSIPVPLHTKYAHGRRPYVFGRTVIETHRPYSPGDVRLMRALQEEINEITNQRIDNVKFAMNKRYFVRRNKQVDIRSLTRNTPSGVTMMLDPDGDVRIVDTPDVTASSYQEQDRLNLDMDDVAGTFSASSVQSNRRLNETVGGMNLLTDNTNQLSNYRLKTFVETWVEPVLRQLTLLEQEYETDEKILALAGKAANLQRFGVDAITDDLLRNELTITVDVGMGTTSPNSRINNLLLAVRGIREALEDGTLERFGVDPAQIIKEIFGALGHKNGGKFFNPDAGEDPKITTLRNEIASLQQQLEAKHPQAVTEATVRKLEEEAEFYKARKVATGVGAAYSAIQTAEVIAAVPQVAPIADKVLEASGYTQPTPPGIDPNLPMTAGEAVGSPGSPGLAPAAQEAAAVGPIDVPESGNTSPMFPATPGAGAKQGIETPEADGVQFGGGVAP